MNCPLATPVPGSIGELMATDLALRSVNNVLATMDRIKAHDEHIAAALADYRAITNPERNSR